MKFCATLIAVKDMDQSLRFYKNLFNQDVVVDLGWNKTLTCGLTLQEHFDEFIALLNQYPDVEILHEPKTFPWLQRGVRIFDPDGHLIEISESMYSVACKQFKQGKDVEQTAELIGHPLNVVQAWYEEYRKAN